jgi:hypothetical protein
LVDVPIHLRTGGATVFVWLRAALTNRTSGTLPSVSRGWAALTLRGKVAAGAIVVAISGAAGLAAAGWSGVPRGAGVGAAIAVVFASWMRWPKVAASLLAQVVVLPVTVVSAGYQAAVVSPGFPYPQVALTPWVVWATLTFVVVHRSRAGRPWARILAVTLTASVAGAVLGGWIGVPGVVIGYLLSGIVLLTVSGYLPGVRGFLASVADWAWWFVPRRRAGQATTMRDLLTGLPEDYGYFVLPNPPDGVEEGVVVHGPSGMILVHSVVIDGVARQHPLDGLKIGSHSVADDLQRLMESRTALARSVDVPVDRIRPVLLASRALLPHPRVRVALHSGAERVSDAVIVRPDRLVPEIVDAPSLLSKKAVARQHRRLARVMATAQVDGSAGVARLTRVVEVDADGRTPVLPSPAPGPDNPETPDLREVLTPGRNVVVFTDQGLFTGVRVVSGPYRDERGADLVNLCVDEEWVSAVDEGREPDTYPYPVASVRPA